MDTTHVLISGAGPAGLTLGIELARRGVPCQVVNAATGISPASRGKGLQPRTLEVFDDLGVLGAVWAGGCDYPVVRGYSGHEVVWEGRMMEVTEPTPDIPYPNGWMIPQWRTERILRDRLAALGVSVRDGTELTGFTADGEGVTATVATAGGERAIRARYLVGADGGHSTVRRVLGVGFAGETREGDRMLFGDLRVDGLDRDYWHMWSNAPDRSDTLGLCPLPGTDTYQFVAADPDDGAELDHAEIQALITARTGRDDIRLREIAAISRYRVNMRMAERFRAGRVFLAGDAAHVHSPAGGQGLNTSVQDSYNLGWKLAAVLAGADDSLLDSYEAERMPVAADVLRISTALHRHAVPDGTGPVKRGRETQQLDIGYAGGPLAPETGDGDVDGSGVLCAGDRAPDAPGLRRADGTAVRLFDLFRGPHLTLLAFGAHLAAPATELAAPYGPAVRAVPVLHTGEPPGPAG
ncbi:MAG: FAD-dependent monooxygenase, partial [Pseudonocardia sp.]|nr:FAD-dependent monooxygenase [Pseudonocardia sp.]